MNKITFLRLENIKSRKYSKNSQLLQQYFMNTEAGCGGTINAPMKHEHKSTDNFQAPRKFVAHSFEKIHLWAKFNVILEVINLTN